MNTFDFAGQQLRTIDIDGQPWFALADTCRCLGLKAHNTSGSFTHHLGKLGADERRTAELPDLPTARICRHNRRQTVVSESGLYKLIMRSDKPDARSFQDWVTRDVLPSIRRSGGYLLNENARQTADADTREAMPLPAEFLQVFQRTACWVGRSSKVIPQVSRWITEGALPSPPWQLVTILGGRIIPPAG